jgi:hypothetical protein
MGVLLLPASGTRTFLLRGAGEIAVSYDGSPVGPSAWFGGVGVPGIRLSNRLLLQGLDRAALVKAGISTLKFGSRRPTLRTSQSVQQPVDCHLPRRCPTAPVLDRLASHQDSGVSVDWLWGLQQCNCTRLLMRPVSLWHRPSHRWDDSYDAISGAENSWTLGQRQHDPSGQGNDGWRIRSASVDESWQDPRSSRG